MRFYRDLFTPISSSPRHSSTVRFATKRPCFLHCNSLRAFRYPKPRAKIIDSTRAFLSMGSRTVYRLYRVNPRYNTNSSYNENKREIVTRIVVGIVRDYSNFSFVLISCFIIIVFCSLLLFDFLFHAYLHGWVILVSFCWKLFFFFWKNKHRVFSISFV